MPLTLSVKKDRQALSTWKFLVCPIRPFCLRNVLFINFQLGIFSFRIFYFFFDFSCISFFKCKKTKQNTFHPHVVLNLV